ncbi:MAG: Gfo/Idh/MocA family oxidoreductase [Anaerolineae bacterium]|nr:Gfo/Idh/MocA family oxidoreductase [Anaerolineae bacterium]
MIQPLKIVLAGCGSMSAAWLRAAAAIEGVQVVGFVDIQEAAARARATEFGGTDAFVGTDLQTALDQTQPDIVFDCTIPEAHVSVTLTALKHGCHVLGEKPLADSMDNARRMVDAAQESGKLYAVIQNRRYDPNIRRLKAFLESGSIGALTTVNSDFFIGAHFGGFRDRMEHVLLLDMAIHTFDAARYICGADPVSVYCKEWNPAGSWYDHDASAVAIFEMSNGIVYTYRGSWCAQGHITTWESDWRIIGQTGTVLWRGNADMQAQTVAASEGFINPFNNVDIPPAPEAARVGGHAGLIQEFVACVRTGQTPETLAADNIKSLAMVFGAIASADQGRPVDIKW